MSFQIKLIEGNVVRRGTKILLVDSSGKDVFVEESLIEYHGEAAPVTSPVPQTNLTETSVDSLQSGMSFDQPQPTTSNDHLQARISADRSTSAEQNTETDVSFWKRALRKEQTYNEYPVRNVQELLIKEFGLHKNQFKDCQSRPGDLWSIIADKIEGEGYQFPTVGNRTKGQRCTDKWRALKVTYFKHKKPRTGEARTAKPPYYMLMDSIIGSDQLTCPKFTADSLCHLMPSSSGSAQQAPVEEESDGDNSDNIDDPDLGAGGKRSSTNVFAKRGKKKLRPKSSRNQAFIDIVEKKNQVYERVQNERLKFLEKMHSDNQKLLLSLIRSQKKQNKKDHSSDKNDDQLSSEEDSS